MALRVAVAGLLLATGARAQPVSSTDAVSQLVCYSSQATCEGTSRNSCGTVITGNSGTRCRAVTTAGLSIFCNHTLNGAAGLNWRAPALAHLPAQPPPLLGWRGGARRADGCAAAQVLPRLQRQRDCADPEPAPRAVRSGPQHRVPLLPQPNRLRVVAAQHVRAAGGWHAEQRGELRAELHQPGHRALHPLPERGHVPGFRVSVLLQRQQRRAGGGGSGHAGGVLCQPDRLQQQPAEPEQPVSGDAVLERHQHAVHDRGQWLRLCLPAQPHASGQHFH